MNTSTVPGWVPATGWPARRSASPSTGSSISPRAFSARTAIRRPRATTSTHGFRYAIAHRLYRPGYSMPELSTPPRRPSICWIRVYGADRSNASAVRVTWMPPAVSNSVRPSTCVSTGDPPAFGRHQANA